jgi:uncharacterized membrane protein YeaQ/YmgE (transglycosylase-associated protein family)
MPGENEPSGFILTTLLGVVGAFVATYLGQALGWYQANEGAGLFGAVVGAIIVLAIWGFIAHPQSAVRLKEVGPAAYTCRRPQGAPATAATEARFEHIPPCLRPDCHTVTRCDSPRQCCRVALSVRNLSRRLPQPAPGGRGWVQTMVWRALSGAELCCSIRRAAEPIAVQVERVPRGVLKNPPKNRDLDPNKIGWTSTV